MNAWRDHPMRSQLRQLRTDAGMSLTKAAKLLPVSAEALGAYERGDRIPPASVLIEVLALYSQELKSGAAGTPAAMKAIADDVAGELREVTERLERRLLGSVTP